MNPGWDQRGRGETDGPGRRGRAAVRAGGFSLLELVLAMLVFSLLIGMVFTSARTSLALSNEVVRSQNEEMLRQAFFELLGRRFSALPGNAVFDLKSEDAGSHYLSDLTLQNVPMAFTWGGVEKVAKAVQLSPVLRRDGFLAVVLRYYENEILEDTGDNFRALNEPPFAEIILLEGVRLFEWRVLDGRTLEWGWDWDIRGRMPLQVELTIAFGMQGDKLRHVFWIPPKQNPEVVMRQLGIGGEAAAGRPRDDDGGSAEDGEGGRPGGGRPGVIVRPGAGGRPGGQPGGPEPPRIEVVPR